MIKIRLQRHGARHAPFYRMVVAPAESRRDGRFIELLGTYNPQSSKRESELDLKMERVDYWLQVGAQPTETAKSLIRQGRLSPEDRIQRAESLANAKASRLAAKKNPAPVVEVNATEEPAAEEAVAEEPASEEAVAEEPATEEPAAEEAVAEEPATEESAAEEAVAEEPVSEEPDADKKSSKESGEE